MSFFVISDLFKKIKFSVYQFETKSFYRSFEFFFLDSIFQISVSSLIFSFKFFFTVLKFFFSFSASYFQVFSIGCVYHGYRSVRSLVRRATITVRSQSGLFVGNYERCPEYGIHIGY